MAEYRCMKHDRVFEAVTDIRKPGANPSVNPDTGKPDGKLPGHPAGGGHPDCPKCQEDAKAAKPAQAAQTSSTPAPGSPVTATRRIA
jgi:hypothetical protein